MKKYKIFSLFFMLLACSSLNVSAMQLPSYSEKYSFAIVSDIHLGASEPMDLAPVSSNEKNDLDLNTYISLIKSLKQSIALEPIKPKIVFVLGDMLDHWNASIYGNYNGRIYYLNEAFNQLALGISVPLAYVFGNNDSLEGNYKSFSTTQYALHSPIETVDKQIWKGDFMSIGTICELHTHYPCSVKKSKNLTEGYYVGYLQPKLKFIGINSVMFHKRVLDDDKYKTQLAWLDKELQNAHDQNESVILIMHVPPGIDLYNGQAHWKTYIANEFLTILKNNNTNVIAILVGHTHMEEIQLINFSNKIYIPIIYTSGFSTSHGNLPSYKMVEVIKDKKTHQWKLQNYITYHYINGEFKRYYDFQSTYCSNKRSDSIADCLVSFVKENKLEDMMRIMNKHYTAGNPNNHFQIPTKNPNNLVIHDAIQSVYY